ncbi:hypothetical protein HYT23_05380 [Candidatus Pacearchaeota archaeon]|nr:hypothetical protein [Candidatus Pacearchaeota archaeon]
MNETIRKGLNYLTTNSLDGRFKCYLSQSREEGDIFSISPREIGSSLLVLNPALINYPSNNLTKQVIARCKNHMVNGKFNFFEDSSLLPTDVETTSYGLTTLLELKEMDKGLADLVANEVMGNVNNNEVIEVFFKPLTNHENRVDHVSLSNVLYFLNLLGRGNQAKESEDFVFDQLSSGRYLEGTRYYHSPDSFIYFLSKSMNFPNLGERFKPVLARELSKRINSTNFPLDLAMRSITADALCFPNDRERRNLRDLQEPDGSWPFDAIYHYGSKAGYFGSKAITTSFAIEALKNSP